MSCTTTHAESTLAMEGHRKSGQEKRSIKMRSMNNQNARGRANRKSEKTGVVFFAAIITDLGQRFGDGERLEMKLTSSIA